MVRNPGLFKSTFKLKDPFWSTKNISTLQPSFNAKASWGDGTRGQMKPEVKCHIAFNHNSFQIVWSGYLLRAPSCIILCLSGFLFEILFLCNVTGRSVLNFLVTQVKEVFHLIRSHISAPVLWVDLFIISISLFQYCRVFFCQQQQHICTLCACYSFSWMSKSSSDECPWG